MCSYIAYIINMNNYCISGFIIPANVNIRKFQVEIGTSLLGNSGSYLLQPRVPRGHLALGIRV